MAIGGERVERVARLVVAERLDDRAAEEILAAADLAQQRLPRRADRRRCAASARTSAGRTNSACSLSSAASSVGDHRRVGIVLEEAVGDGAQPIVRARQRLAHRVLRARIVEAGQQHQRAIADVAVGVLGDGLQQRRHGLRAGVRRTVREAVVRVVVVEIAELVDRGLQLRRRTPAAAPAAPGPTRCARRSSDAQDADDDSRRRAAASRR